MAKKKQKKATPRRKGGRRRRIGAFGSDINIESAALTVVGGLASRVAGNALTKVKFAQKPVVRLLIKGGTGIFLRTRKNQTMRDVGDGVLVETLLDAAGQYFPNQFGPVNTPVAGIGRTLIDLDNVVSGAGDMMERDHAVGAFNSYDDWVGAI